MTAKLNTADGGTNGTTVTTGNSGGGSGNALSGVSVDTVNGGALTFSSTQKAHGSLSYHHVTGATSTTAYFELALAAQQPAAFAGVYIYQIAYPTASTTFLRIFGGSTNGSLSMTSAGVVNVLNNAGSTVSAIPNFVMPLNKWVRFELGVLVASTTVGQLEARVFSTNPESYTPDYSYLSAATVNSGATPGTVRIGPNGAANIDYYSDTIQISDAGFPGPFAPSDALMVGQMATFG